MGFKVPEITTSSSAASGTSVILPKSTVDVLSNCTGIIFGSKPVNDTTIFLGAEAIFNKKAPVSVVNIPVLEGAWYTVAPVSGC